MWKKLQNYITKGDISVKELNLENTLMSGQCFNWRVINNTYIGCVGKNVISLKEENGLIYYKFIYKNNNIDEQYFFYEYFQLEVKLDEIIKTTRLDNNSELNKIIQSISGVRIIKQDLFECIISFICSSNNNISRIRKMLDELRKLFGTKLYEDNNSNIFYSFPSLNDLYNLDENILIEKNFGYRAKFIAKSIDYMKQNPDWLESIEKNNGPLEDLMKLTGVGRKVADCIALFSLKYHHIVPLDVHMINFYNETIVNMGKNFKKIENLSKVNYKIMSDNYIKIFGPYAGWLHSIFYINRIKKLTPIENIDEKKLISKRKRSKTKIKKNNKKLN